VPNPFDALKPSSPPRSPPSSPRTFENPFEVFAAFTVDPAQTDTPMIDARVAAPTLSHAVSVRALRAPASRMFMGAPSGEVERSEESLSAPHPSWLGEEHESPEYGGRGM